MPKICFSTPYFKIEQLDSLPHQGGSYYRMTGPDSVIMCILDQSDRFILVRQFRPALNQFSIEFPAGAIDRNETPAEAFSRELGEETGMLCERYCYLGKFHLMMNRTKIYEHLFFCMGPKVSNEKKIEENISVIKLPRAQLKDMVKNGEYMQLAGLGILQLIEIDLNVSILNDSYESIHLAFLKKSLCV